MNLRDLPARLGTTGRLLVKEISAFGVVGAACTVIDLGLFQLLYVHAGMGAVVSRFMSTVVAMTAGYFGHRHWSFSHRARTGAGREYLLFAIINGLTLLLSLGIVALVRYPLHQAHSLVLQGANIFSIGLGTVVRYLCYRQWVFLAVDAPSPPRSGTSAALDPAA